MKQTPWRKAVDQVTFYPSWTAPGPTVQANATHRGLGLPTSDSNRERARRPTRSRAGSKTHGVQRSSEGKPREKEELEESKDGCRERREETL